ncbi:MAG: putative acylesterase/phospholipase RssA [Chlamydiales bacterium]|jgi:predicted acylesterase/phospholipase RssA
MSSISSGMPIVSTWPGDASYYVALNDSTNEVEESMQQESLLTNESAVDNKAPPEITSTETSNTEQKSDSVIAPIEKASSVGSVTRGRRKVSILSVDCGGVRGIIPTILLNEIEHRTHTASANLFDLMAGSSTGGLITTGLNIPLIDRQPRFTARNMMALFEYESPEIFSCSNWHTMTSLFYTMRPKYSPLGMDNVLNRYLGDTLVQDSITDLYIPTYDITTPSTYFFSRHKCRTNPALASIKMKDIVRCTTAAPTYFPPKEMIIEDKFHAMVDGGTFLYNPSLSAYNEAMERYPNAEDYLVCSLGTGYVPFSYSPAQSQKGGYFWWADKFLYSVFHGISHIAHEQMTQITSRNNSPYYYFQTTLEYEHCSLDDTSRGNITYLKEKGFEIVEERSDEIRELCMQLEANKNHNEQLEDSYKL